MPVRSGSAEWRGDLKGGKGELTVGNGTWKAPYNFNQRFAEEPGTNPEELIGAAHAACFSMALSGGLGGAGFTPDWVRTTAKVHIDPDGGGFSIGTIDLDCEASVPGIDDAAFQDIAEKTKQGCPVSKVLAGAKINLTARLAAQA
jgi:osmotically inducible protein OsmC